MSGHRFLGVCRFRNPTRKFFYLYIAINWAIAVVLGLVGVMPDSDLYAWTNYTAITVGMTMGHAVGYMALPVIIYSVVNANSIKKAKGSASGWWIITPSIFVYLFGLLGVLWGA